MKMFHEGRRHMKYIVAALVGTLVAQGNLLRAEHFIASLGPYAIYLPGARPADRKIPTEVGLLYTPELLTALAGQSPDSVTLRVSEAIRQQTPIVVLWTIPPIAATPAFPRPFSTVIVEANSGYSGVPRVEPIWVEQHAEDLRQLDPQRSFQDVGVMAAFPRSAFVPGKWVIIYRQLPTLETAHWRGVQRFGLIEWNGAQR
jgi:hypothetical protein